MISILFWLGCIAFTDDKDTGYLNYRKALLCEDRDMILNIGTGEADWEDLSAGDSLVMVHGPQGGWHMLGSISLQNVNQIVEVGFQITDIASGIMIADNDYQMALTEYADCAGFYFGMYGYLDVEALQSGALDTPPELLEGHELLLHMRANDCSASRDSSGECDRESRWTEDSFSVIAALDPIDR